MTGLSCRYELERNEIIALFNLLAKLADSAHLVAEMSLLLTDPHHRSYEEFSRPRPLDHELELDGVRAGSGAGLQMLNLHPEL